MDENNPLTVKPISLKDKFAVVSSVMAAASPSIADATGTVKPVEYFGKYIFTDKATAADDAAKLITSEDFQKFWNRKNVSQEGVGVRVQTSENPVNTGVPAHKRPNYAEVINRRDASTKKSSELFAKSVKPMARDIPNSPVDEFGRRVPVIITPEEQIATHTKNMHIARSNIRNLARVDNRFYTPIEKQKAISSYLNFALDHQSGTSRSDAGVRLPIKLLMDERLPNFSLKGYKPFMMENADPNKLQQIMGGIAADSTRLNRRYGLDLGASVSSNPSEEFFVPKTLSNTARTVGGVLPDETIEVIGKPRVPVNTQMAKNIIPFMGQSMAKVSPYLGAVGTGVMAYQGYKDYNSSDRNTREYGATDQFGLRANYDFGIDVLSGTHSIPQAWEAQRKLVADPEWQMRNPLAATLYNTAHGNLEPIKAFAEAYVPNFLK